MDVILNAESLVPPRTGIGNYTLHLLRGLTVHPRIGEVRCFLNTRWVEPEIAMRPAASNTVQPGGHPAGKLRLRGLLRALPGAYPVRAWVRSVLFKRSCSTLRHAVYHEPNFILKPFSGPTITTIHDLSHIHFPQFHPRERVAYMERNLPQTLRRAAHILTDSAFVRGELMEQFSIPPQRITAIPLGVDPHFRPQSFHGTRALLASHGLQHGRYLLSVATFEPRKNLLGLLHAYQQLPAKLRRDFPLVLIGAPGWHSSEIDRAIDRLSRCGEVRMLGYVSEYDLPTVYAGAAAFVFVSFYEGFGLPILEAMGCGIPVLTSNRSSMPEVAGGAALLADPYDHQDIAQRLTELLDDEPLRMRYAAAGIARAAGFSWATCVERTVEVYHHVYASSGRAA